mmetsp:Transcript_9097/g.12189  ORF Transcript_9097/g.12189 Transcript_9097/m.12189 type:complete len:215 (+) Transcript_9097:63-707(+)
MDIDTTVKIMATTEGRDKVYKAVQNLARFLEWSGSRSGDFSSAKKYGVLAKSMGDGRSLMRLGKWIQNLRKMREISASGAAFDTVDGLVEYGRVSADFGFVVGDNISYLAKYNILSNVSSQWVSRRAKVSQFWAFLFACILDILKLIRAYKAEKVMKDLIINFVRNFADLLATLDATGYASCVYKPCVGFTSMCGLLSGSIATYQNVIKASAKH